LIRNGKSVVAWDHCWIEDGIDIPANLKAATVFELIDENGDWQVA
jgi:hypothetical protein